ncbi:MAG: hypothetical protein ACRC8A_06205 [Microcoleaceae cyanobacterium]
MPGFVSFYVQIEIKKIWERPTHPSQIKGVGLKMLELLPIAH